MRILKPILSLALLLSVLLAACSLTTGSPTASLAGSEWVLTALNGTPPLEGSQITLSFEEDQAGGGSGCNSYGGEYTIEANDKIAFGPMLMTEMACMDPVGVMDQETAYLQTLAQTAGFEVQEDRLILKNAAGDAILEFEKA